MTFARRFGDNGELVTRVTMGVMLGRASVREAAARAVARALFKASDDGGGTCSSRMPLAQPRERNCIKIVALKAGALV